MCTLRTKNQQVKLIDKPNVDVPGLLCLYSSQEDKKELRNGVIREEPELLPSRRRQLRSSGRLVRMPPCSLCLEVFQP